jgi:hypothetical protein
MADQITETKLTTLPDQVALSAHLTSLASEARDILNRAWVAVEEGADKDIVQDALVAIDGKVQELQAFGEQSAAIVNGLVEMSKELTAQRDAAVQDYQTLEDHFDERLNEAVGELVDEGIHEQIDHLLGCPSCRNDMEVDWLAERIGEEGFEALAEEQRKQLEDRLKAARETHEHWHAYAAGPAMGQAEDEVPAPFIVDEAASDEE